MYRVVIRVSESEVKDIQSSLRKVYFSQKKLHDSSFMAESNPIEKMYGEIHLLKNIKQSSTTFNLKSKAILIVNPGFQTMKFLEQHIQEIQNYDIVNTENKITDKVKGQLTIGELMSYIIVFKSPTIAEEFFNVMTPISDQFAYFYVQDVVILCGNTSQEQFRQTIEKQFDISHEKWARIPTCPMCLLLVETDVSGIVYYQNIHEKGTYKSIFNCKACYYRQKADGKCQQCGQQKDIWICLICGILGCGRYKNADAEKHYRETNHILSYDIQTGGIWNYLNDCFCHKVMGKQCDMVMQMSQSSIIDDQNIQGTFWKYCGIISQQLQEQRAYYNKVSNEQVQKFEHSLKQMDSKISELTSIRSDKMAQLKKKQKRFQKQEKKNKQLQQQCEEERVILSQLEISAKIQCKQYQETTILAIKKKKQELQNLQKQIEQVLSGLT